LSSSCFNAEVDSFSVHADLARDRFLERTRSDASDPQLIDTPPLGCAWRHALDVYLIDGTYELFRHYYALPSARDQDGREIGAVRGVLASMLGMIKGGVTHLAVATDHVIESFRNGLWPGYKTGEGIEPDLLAQFPLLEETLSAAGIAVWPMVEFEADDALTAGAVAAARDERVERAIICTPDKDLAQCVSGTRIVQLNRRTRVTLDEAGVVRKIGVPPVSIPDYLALVGDAADGYPGLSGWGAKSTAAVLAKFRHLESIPRTGASGTSTPPTRVPLHTRSARSASRRCYFERSPRSGPT
jgi:5'-3' exonuclease